MRQIDLINRFRRLSELIEIGREAAHKKQIGLELTTTEKILSNSIFLEKLIREREEIAHEIIHKRKRKTLNSERRADSSKKSKAQKRKKLVASRLEEFQNLSN